MRFINKQYLNYYRKAQTVQSIHSPFLYKLLMESIENKRMYNVLIELEQLHRSKPDVVHMSPVLLTWIFHWMRVINPDTVIVEQHASPDLKWLVNRISPNTTLLNPFTIIKDKPIFASEQTVLIILNSNHSEILAQLPEFQDQTVMIVCLDMSTYNKLPAWVNLTVDLYDVQLIFRRPELSAKQAFTVIEKRKKRLDFGLFPK